MDKKSMILKNIPEDVYAELLKVQSEERQKIKRQFSLEKCVYKIIKSTIKDKQ